jgi:sporulation protein YlmC with PRC-barrel domain
MLQLSEFVHNRNVLSLRAGEVVATALGPIINPNNLKIEGFYCHDRFGKKDLILLTQDIRETLKEGFVVDDHERLVEASELVRLKDILDLHFELIGKPVETIDKEKVGKVNEFAVETESMIIVKLYAHQPLYKNLTGGSLSIDRNQIQEITPNRIIISELLKGSPATAPSVA